MKNIILFISLFLCSVVNVAAQQYFPFKEGGEAPGYGMMKSETDGDNYRDVTYTFGGALFEEIEISGRPYKNVMVQGLMNIMEKGVPSLPWFNDIISVESSDLTLEILNIEEREFEGFDIAPSQGPILQMSEDDSVYVFSELYKKNAYYPDNRAVLSKIQKKKGKYRADVNVYPIQYNPMTGTIRCCQSITYRISWTKDDTPSPREEPIPEDGSDTKIVSISKPGCDYIIVTTPQLEGSLDDFLAWKAMQGHKCHVISDEWTAGDTTAIRDRILSVYEANTYAVAPDYLLIVGDYNAVPGYLMDQPKDSRGERDYTKEFGQISSDLKYRCLDGDGEDDFSPELAAGRIPAANVEEARNVFQKIIRYEMDPTEDVAFYDHAVHCAQFEKSDADDSKDKSVFIYGSEQIRDKLLCFGKTIDRVYATGSTVATPKYFYTGTLLPKDIRWPSSVWNGNTSDIINQINSGCFYALHRDHGDLDGWCQPRFYVSDLSRLSNKDQYPVVFSINCLTGSYQAPYLSPYKKSCFASSILTMKEAGAVGVVAASGVSYSYENNAFINNVMDYLYVTPSTARLHSDAPVYEMGKLVDVANELVGSKYSMQIFHYFGDPSMQMYTEVPACFEDPTITQDGTSVTVKMNGVEDCNIAISSYLDHGQSFVNVAEGVSSVTFKNIDFPYVLVISKHNYKPLVIEPTDFDTDRFIQNKTIKEDVVEIGRNISLGKSVTTTQAEGAVVVEAGSKLDLKATRRIYFSKGFKTDGGQMYATIVRGGDSWDYICNFSYRDPVSVYDESLKNPYLADDDDPDVDPYDNPILTGNEDKLGGADFVYGGHQTIVVQMSQPTDIEVYNVVGQLLGSYQGVSQATYDFEPGVYLVKYSGKVAKVQVLR